MQIAIFSDVHAIPLALHRFKIELGQVDAYWFLGDALGYGPLPVMTLDVLHKLMTGSDQHVCLLGNHDLAVLENYHSEGTQRIFEIGGKEITTDRFRRCARQIVDSHTTIMAYKSPHLLDWMAKWPLRAMPIPGFYIAHGDYTANDAETAWVYGTRTRQSARSQLIHLRQQYDENHVPETPRLIAVGHYHVPALYRWNAESDDLEELDPWARDWYTVDDPTVTPLVVNPGSISLPRPAVAHPRPSYILLEVGDDFRTFKLGFRELYYDCERVLRDIPDGYPCLDENLRKEIRLGCKSHLSH